MERQSYQKVVDRSEVHWWYVSRRVIIKRILDRLINISIKHKKILEIGCGSGGNLAMLEEYGELHATEFDDEARKLATSKKLCFVEKAKLPDRLPFETRFDLICMLDVLEHIDHDLAALQTVENSLEENGQLLLTVPAYQFLWTCADLINHHYRRYNKKGLVALIMESNLEIEYVTYFNTFLFPFVAIGMFVLEKLNRESSEKKFDRMWLLPLAPVNKLLAKIFSSEKHCLPRVSFPFGSSILVLARKVDNKN